MPLSGSGRCAGLVSRIRLSCAAALLTLLAVPGTVLAVQEPPPHADEAGTATASATEEAERIAPDRPALHTLKRTLHPLAWIRTGVKPLVRLAGTMSGGTDSDSPVGFGFGRVGAGSGFGPELRLGYGVPRTPVDLHAAATFTYKQYEAYRTGARVWLPLERQVTDLDMDVYASYVSRASDNFFGIGNSTERSDKSHFRSLSREIGLAAGLSFAVHWRAGASAGQRDIEVLHPRSDVRSAKEAFVESETPGLDSGARLRSVGVWIERDTRDRPLAHQGGREHVSVTRTRSSGGEFSYWRYFFEVERHVPLSDDGRTRIALRAAAETNQETAGARVPFFELARVGGRESVRGFPDYRFQDRSSVAWSAEYLYRIWQYFDWGLFVDQAQVAPEPGDFGLGRFHTGYGFRWLVVPSENLGMSIDAGRSREGWVLYFNLNPGS